MLIITLECSLPVLAQNHRVDVKGERQRGENPSRCILRMLDELTQWGIDEEKFLYPPSPDRPSWISERIERKTLVVSIDCTACSCSRLEKIADRIIEC